MIPEFKTKDDLFKWLHTNKDLLIAQKKSEMKKADSVIIRINDQLPTVAKAINLGDADKIEVVSIINTTKLFDSHGDVHIDGLWNKSLSIPNRKSFLVKEHKFNFDGIITDEVKAYTQDFTWKELGFPWEGKTQALTYKSIIYKGDSTGMFGRYVAGKVDQHSVGMQYVKMVLAIDNKNYKEEKENYDKYYGMIANKEEVDEAGYFWGILEAKDIEGSAVVKGSNFVTPTTSVKPKQVKSIPVQEQVKSTPKINVDEALKHFKLNN